MCGYPIYDVVHVSRYADASSSSDDSSTEDDDDGPTFRRTGSGSGSAVPADTLASQPRQRGAAPPLSLASLGGAGASGDDSDDSFVLEVDGTGSRASASRGVPASTAAPVTHVSAASSPHAATGSGSGGVASGGGGGGGSRAGRLSTGLHVSPFRLGMSTSDVSHDSGGPMAVG